jgi:AraC family transcriptional regulator
MTSRTVSHADPSEVNYSDWATGHLKDEWRVEKNSLHTRHMAIEHLIMPGSTVDFPPLTEHAIVVALTHQSRQVNQFGGGAYDGVQSVGEFFLLPARVPAFFHWDIPHDVLALTIHPKGLQQVAAETECLNPDNVELRSVLLSHDPQLATIIQSFHAEMNQVGMGGRLYSESLANILNIHLLRQYCTQTLCLRRYEGGLGRHTLKKILEYIESHLDQDLSLDTLASLANLSKYHFIDLFKQSMTMTPHQYVIQQRIQRAKELLSDRTLAISDVGLACGFANQSHFTRLFRKHTGVPPKAYRDR